MNPYLSLEGLAGILFFLACSLIVVFRIGQINKLQAVDVSILSMGMIYGLMLPLVVTGNVIFPGFEFVLESRSISALHTGAATLAVFGLYWGWRATPQKALMGSSRVFYNIRSSRIIFWLYIFLGIAVGTQYLYTIDYGGFFGYFSYNRLIRSGLFDTFDRSRFSFLLPFGGFAVVACYGFWGLLLSPGRGTAAWIGFILSFFASLYVLAASLGRISIATFLAVLVLGLLIKLRIRPLSLMLVFILGIPTVLILLQLGSTVFDIRAADDVIVFVTREVSFVFSGFFAQMSDGDLFGIFREIAIAPVFLLPSSWTTPWLVTAADLNTVIISGARKGEQGVTGAMPVDMITFGLMQFHFLGVLLYSFVFGILLRCCSALAQSFKLEGMAAVFLAYVMLRIGIIGVFYSYPQHIIVGNFAIIAILMGIFSFRIFSRLLLGARFSQSTTRRVPTNRAM